jgi:hypothetical protein
MSRRRQKLDDGFHMARGCFNFILLLLLFPLILVLAFLISYILSH